MRIAQVAPLIESVPPRLYGGTERIVVLPDGRARPARARRDAVRERRLRDDGELIACVPEGVAARSERTRRHSVLHARCSIACGSCRRVRHPALPHRPVSFSAVSVDRRPHRDHAARAPGPARPSCRSMPAFPRCRWCRSRNAAQADADRELRGQRCLTASRRDLLRLVAQSARRLPRLPRPHRAGEAARPRHRDRAARSACRSRSRPRSTASTKPISTRRSSRCSTPPGVEFIGEINDQQKAEFLGEALALLFPIDWPEPFGLVDDRGDGLRHAGARLPAAARCRR